MSNFDNDLIFGKKGELIILDIISRKFPDAFIKEGKNKGYDIEIPAKKIYVEVKTDKKSKETGNIAIECQYKGKYSGIRTTTADWWCIIYYDNGWKYAFIETETLSSLCDNFSPVPAGDSAICHLIPIDTFKRYYSSSGEF